MASGQVETKEVVFVIFHLVLQLCVNIKGMNAYIQHTVSDNLSVLLINPVVI